LTENIVKMQEIYGAIETGRIMVSSGKKKRETERLLGPDQSGPTVFFMRSLWSFSKFDLPSGNKLGQSMDEVTENLSWFDLLLNGVTNANDG
jgi:hypothetical protein